MKTPALNNMYWLVKREFWEHRGGFLWAPIIGAGIFVLLNIMGIITAEVFRSRANVHFNGMDFNELARHMDGDALNMLGNVLDGTIYGAASIITLILAVVVFFYSLNTLAEDRRDRSILFWKSLPLADSSMVLSKVISALVVAPVIAIIVSILAGLLMLVIIAITASFHGANLWQVIWTLPHPVRIVGQMLKTLPLYVVWALPAVGWLMLCSAWSRSKQFLWAVALPIGAGVMVSWFSIMDLFNLGSSWFWANVVGRALLSVIPGGWVFRNGVSSLIHVQTGHSLVNGIGAQNDYAQLVSPQFLIGALAGIIMISGAIWLRRWRTQM